MKKSALLIVFLASSFGTYAEEIIKELKHFTRIVASPRVHVVLRKGDRESVRLVYNNVNKNKINIEVDGRTLSIYLDHARRIEKLEDTRGHARWMYEGVTITAYITYKELEYLEVRGEQSLICYDEIDTEEFRLKVYGENEITLAHLKTDYFKASLYGQNELTIESGKAVEQKYKLYGENKIDTRAMKSAFASTSIFGEGNLKINSTEELRVDAFGEPTLSVYGGGNVSKRLVVGKASIRKY